MQTGTDRLAPRTGTRIHRGRPADRSAARIARGARPERIAAIDGLRAIAIAGVVLYHLRPSVLPGGFLGVSMFFVLTGFLATRSVLAALGRKHADGDVPGQTGGAGFSYPRYLLRRLKRLMPPALVAIGLIAALTYLAGPSLLPKVQSDALPAALFFSNWSYIFRKVPYFAAAGLPSPLTHLWFLGVTMQFYLVWPLVLLALRRLCPSRSRAAGAIAALALASTLAMALLYDPAGDTARVYYGTDTRAAELLVGALLACALPSVGRLLHRAARRFGAIPTDAVAAACLFLLVLGFALADGEASWLYRGGYLLAALLTAACLACSMVPGSAAGRVLSARPLRYLGSRSFSLYLVHYPLFILMNPATRTTAVTWWEQALQVIVAIAAAEAFYRLVERPLGGLARTGSRNGERCALNPLPYALPALGCAATLALAFAPVNWNALAQARAEALRPELTADANAPSGSDGTSGDGTQAEDGKGDSSKTRDGSGTDADTDASKADASKSEEKATEEQKTKPVAEKVPANLDASKWTFDEEKGTCDADVIIIGDSVTEGAAPTLQRMLPNAYVDGKVSRQLLVGPEVYAQDTAAGYDASAVVVALGGNSLIRDKSQVQAMIDAVNGKPLYFVTIRSPLKLQDINNKILREFAEENDNVGIIDWKGASEGHSEYLVDDGIHLTTKGAEAFAGLIRKALCGR